MYHHSCSVVGSLDVLGTSAPPRSASHPCLKAYAVSYSLAAALLLKISSICQFVNPIAWFCQYTRLPSRFMVIPILHGMRFFTSSYYQGHGECKFYYYRKTEPGSHVYMCSVERVESYDNSLTYTFNPNSILALQFYYYYIASEGSVNTPSIVVVSLLLNSREPYQLGLRQIRYYVPRILRIVGEIWLIALPLPFSNADKYEW